MNSIIFFPACYAVIGFLHMFFSKKYNIYIWLSRASSFFLTFAFICMFFFIKPSDVQTISFIDYLGVSFNIVFLFDHLSRLMLFVIIIISSCIIRYSENYLQSDVTQGRFLGQVNFVVASVCMLTLAGNLFTAFIAWQLIGLSLYALLNHYHYNLAANKAAKKKFIINRIGDLCFLVAIILVYQNSSVSIFSHLSVFSNDIAIPILILIAVMTKSAQFPFHIWLPDTLETPTPVSALMHAGVINAGGLLLIRCSPMLNGNTTVLILIMIVGLSTVFIANLNMNRQGTVKKKLAYSTMGQMGYMVFQCGTGLFSAALFHLIAHGFLKSYLFLGSGKELRIEHAISEKKLHWSAVFSTLLLSLAALILFTLLENYSIFSTPILFKGLILITVINLFYRFSVKQPETRFVAVFGIYILSAVTLCMYSHHEINIYCNLDFFWIKSTGAQLFILTLVIFIQFFYSNKIKKCKINGLRGIGLRSTESYYRELLLHPLRVAGEKANAFLDRFSILKTNFFSLTAFLIIGFSIFIFNSYNRETLIFPLNHSICFLILVSVLSMVIGNRARKISGVFFWLTVFQAGILFTLLLNNNNIVFTYYSANMLLVLAFLFSLLRKNKKSALKSGAKRQNKLSLPLFYFSTSLLLLIGVPGTASFIGEIFLFKFLANQSMALLFSYAAAMIFLAITLMHVLQLHVFRLNFSNETHLTVTAFTHVLFYIMLAENILSGLIPQLVLKWVSKII